MAYSTLVKMRIVNKPQVSGPLKWFYAATVAFLAIVAAAVTVTFLYIQTAVTEAVVGLTVLVGVEIVMLSLLTALYRTEYILTSEELIIKASFLIGGTKTISLKNIESMEKTLIPLGFRIFGASFYGGYYYLPSIGRAFVVMTNFKDGVLIRSKQGTYVITPRDPEEFIEKVEKTRTTIT